METLIPLPDGVQRISNGPIGMMAYGAIGENRKAYVVHVPFASPDDEPIDSVAAREYERLLESTPGLAFIPCTASKPCATLNVTLAQTNEGEVCPMGDSLPSDRHRMVVSILSLAVSLDPEGEYDAWPELWAVYTIKTTTDGCLTQCIEDRAKFTALYDHNPIVLE